MGIAQAGMLFFRPCVAVAQHMMDLAAVRTAHCAPLPTTKLL